MELLRLYYSALPPGLPRGTPQQRAGRPPADHRGREPLPARHGGRQPDHQPHREPEPSGHKDHRAAQAHPPGELLPAGGAALGSAFSARQCPLPGAAAQRLLSCPQSRQRKKRCILRGYFYAKRHKRMPAHLWETTVGGHFMVYRLRAVKAFRGRRSGVPAGRALRAARCLQNPAYR